MERIGRAAFAGLFRRMNGFHEAFVIFLGDEDDVSGIPTSNQERPLIVAHRIHIRCKFGSERAVRNMCHGILSVGRDPIRGI